MIRLSTLAVVVAVLAVPAAAVGQPQARQTTAPSAATPSTATFAADAVVSVNGLVCDFCAQTLDKSFKRHAQVRAIRVDLTAKTVSIDFQPGLSLDDATLRRIITNAGYAVTAIQRTGGPA